MDLGIFHTHAGAECRRELKCRSLIDLRTHSRLIHLQLPLVSVLGFENHSGSNLIKITSVKCCKFRDEQ